MAAVLKTAIGASLSRVQIPAPPPSVRPSAGTRQSPTMWRMSWMPKAFTELVGTFFFLTVIALSGHAGALAPLAIGLALTAMVYMGGHVSGAHYNPAVSFGAFLRGKMPASEMLIYWAAQLVGAALAFTFGYMVTGR